MKDDLEFFKEGSVKRKFKTGCLVCGRELVYQSESGNRICELCGREELTTVACSNGHYVCNNCHAGDIFSQIERICHETERIDPVKLAEEIFDLQDLPMHGPEYHSIVPAIIVAVWGNCNLCKNLTLIHEAIERGKKIPGGVCASQGTCGVAAGLGIAYSIIHQVTPLSSVKRGEALRLTSKALDALSCFGGPRCCKREAVTVLKIARQDIIGYKQSTSVNFQCKQFNENKDCIRERCPYFLAKPMG